jgi:hypothetical protein
MKRYIDEALLPSIGHGYRIRNHVLSLSDTILIAAIATEASWSDPPPEEAATLVDLVCQGAAYVMRNAAQADFPLLYRGVVTAGQLLIDETFILGPAIDEAARHVDEADGAFVWFAPSALAVGRPVYGGPNVWRTMVRDYSVPMKNGGAVATKVLSPFVDMSFEATERDLIRDGYARVLASERVDVRRKRENTLRFLEIVHESDRDEKREPGFR